MKNQKEAKRLHEAELARFNFVCNEMVEEWLARGGKPYEN